MQIGSDYFDDYTRTLRRVCWAEFIGKQAREARRRHFRASLVGGPFTQTTGVTASDETTPRPKPSTA